MDKMQINNVFNNINWSQIIHSFVGIFGFLIIAFVLSENKKKIKPFHAVGAIITQIILATVVLHVPAIYKAFKAVSKGIMAVKEATVAGTSLVFGHLGGGEIPFVMKEGATFFNFAFQVLPMIIVMSALSMLLFHWRILPLIVRGFSWALNKTLNIGGALGVCMSAKVFLGQTDAPLLVRPYLNKMSRSELFTVMTAGMATTSATIMALYAMILEGKVDNPLVHILTASLIGIPAAIAISRIIVPKTVDDTKGDIVSPYNFSSSMDAVSTGTSDGLKLYFGVLSMVLVALALVSLTNSVLSIFPNIAGEAITLERIFGLIMAPVTWLMGIPWSESSIAGSLLAKKTVLNEIVAFMSLAELPKNILSDRTDVMMTYALCGFANFSSVGIVIGALGGMAPDRKSDILQLAFKAMIAGTITSCLSGSVIGLLWTIMH